MHYEIDFACHDSSPQQPLLNELYEYGDDVGTKVLHRCRLNLFTLIMRDLIGRGVSLDAARSGGMPWRTSLALGALMNTRGIMALVIASIGLEIGAISPQVFTILALVAMITTLMTGPLLSILKIGPDAPYPISPVAIPENP